MEITQAILKKHKRLCMMHNKYIMKHKLHCLLGDFTAKGVTRIAVMGFLPERFAVGAECLSNSICCSVALTLHNILCEVCPFSLFALCRMQPKLQGNKKGPHNGALSCLCDWC